MEVFLASVYKEIFLSWENVRIFQNKHNVILAAVLQGTLGGLEPQFNLLILDLLVLRKVTTIYFINV